jgi:hypothetical protein
VCRPKCCNSRASSEKAKQLKGNIRSLQRLDLAPSTPATEVDDTGRWPIASPSHEEEASGVVLDDSVMRRSDALRETMRFARAVIADGTISDRDAKSFRAWIDTNPDVLGLAAIDEIVGILTNVFHDGRLTAAEREQLVAVLERFGG